MKSCWIAVILLGCVVASVRCQQPQEKMHDLVVNKPDHPFVLGNTMSLDIVYKNHSSADWTIDDPRSAGGEVKFKLSAQSGHPHGRLLSHSTRTNVKTPDGKIGEVWVTPPRTKVTVKAGKEFRIPFDFHTPWSDWIVPGRWQLWVADEENKIKSDPIEFLIIFSKDSVPALLDIVSDPQASPYKRQWHAKWLQKLKPDFSLSTPDPKDTPEEAAQKTALDMKTIAEFKAFWETEKDSNAISRLLEKINKE
jgi:hypothetical protein